MDTSPEASEGVGAPSATSLDAATRTEPASEPPTTAGGAQLSLKVRTLDQKTYPITICATASVPQLKERVAVETGVTLARQRLIFRGRVLKNDQPLAAYALEDGHVLHLVVRAEAVGSASASDSTAAAAASSADLDDPVASADRVAGSSRSRSRVRRGSRSPPPPRDNDEPDPTLGGARGANHVLMGATITMAEGADMASMPFLSSMIANLVSQGQDAAGATTINPGAGANGGVSTATADGRRRVTFSREMLGNTAAIEAATARAMRRHHRERGDGGAAGSGSGRTHHGRRAATGAERQAALRARTGLRLDSVRAALDDASLDFPAELATQQQQQEDAAAMAGMQEQVDMLQTLMERFGPRLRLLPAALAQRDRQSERLARAVDGAASTPTGETNSAATLAMSSRLLIRTIETLQSIGEASDLLARMARHVFVRQSMTIGEPIPRRSNAAGSATTAAGSSAAAAAAETPANASQTSPTRRQVHFAPLNSADQPQEGGATVSTASTSSSPMPGSTSTFPVDLTGTSSSSSAAPALAPTSSASSRSSRASHRSRRAAAVAAPPAGTHISISGVGGLPLMSSVVFPFSLAAGLGGGHATTTWNLADFASRVAGELPAATLYGVLTGDAASVHRVLAHVGFALLSGVDVPRVSRPNIRTWSQDLMDELRRLLRTHALPADVLAHVTGSAERRSALGEELLRALEPFVPELVDQLFRATSASRAAAFGASSIVFLRTMVRQILRQLRVYMEADGGSEEGADSTARLERVLQGVVVWLGMDEGMARFAVGNLLAWTEEGDDSGRRGLTRPRDEPADAVAESAANKRRRE
ncbi:hypothetical protein BBJ28_00010193 [Nothophytophthora sp. Chile5]|nr:hypothetical protein BBJ28_00010193 [Nothophytophthora sp. Chile5]